MNQENRLREFDAIKGVAIVLVCLGHILQTTICNYGDTRLYNFIYAIQMPLFIVVSGYFGKLNNTNRTIGQYIKRKTVSYMWPFFSRLLIFDVVFSSFFIPIGDLFNRVFPERIDAGLWFLWVLFFLSISLTISQLLVGKTCLTGFKREILIFFTFFAFLIPWIIISILFGSRFLGAKFILYYSLFYYAGYLYRIFFEDYLKRKRNIRDLFVFLSFIVGVLIVFHVKLLSPEDGLEIIVFRITSGFFLSFLLIISVFKFKDYVYRLKLDYVGRFTLEIYYIHGISFSLFRNEFAPTLYSWEGMLTVIFSFIVTACSCVIIISVIKSNRYLDFIFFGKIHR